MLCATVKGMKSVARNSIIFYTDDAIVGKIAVYAIVAVVYNQIVINLNHRVADTDSGGPYASVSVGANDIIG